MGDLPLMTETGTFVINGAERVIVSQLVRSPGIYYAIAHDKIGKRLFSSTVIPNRGAWLEYETDSNDVFYVRVDRTRKVPITVLIRALGIGTNAEIVELFGEEPKILASFGKRYFYKLSGRSSGTLQEDPSGRAARSRERREPYQWQCSSIREDMILPKLDVINSIRNFALTNRIVGHELWLRTVVDPSTGEILAEAGTNVTVELADTDSECSSTITYGSRVKNVRSKFFPV